MPVVHLVFLKLDPAKDSAPAFAALKALQHTIPVLLSFSGGSNSSQEGLSQGYTHAFSMVFASAAARDAYLPHPAHEAVKQQLFQIMATPATPSDSVAVVDIDFAGGGHGGDQ